MLIHQKLKLYLILVLSFFKYKELIDLRDGFSQQEKVEQIGFQDYGKALFFLINLSKIYMSFDNKIKYYDVLDIPNSYQMEDIKFYYKLNFCGFLLQLLTILILTLLGKNSKWISKLYN